MKKFLAYFKILKCNFFKQHQTHRLQLSIISLREYKSLHRIVTDLTCYNPNSNFQKRSAQPQTSRILTKSHRPSHSPPSTKTSLQIHPLSQQHSPQYTQIAQLQVFCTPIIEITYSDDWTVSCRCRLCSALFSWSL